MEERGEEAPPVAFPDAWPAVQRAQKSVARDLAVQLCRRALERLVVATQPARTAAKLLKGALRAMLAQSRRSSSSACRRLRPRVHRRRAQVCAAQGVAASLCAGALLDARLRRGCVLRACCECAACVLRACHAVAA
jgi:hypothetical protein